MLTLSVLENPGEGFAAQVGAAMSAAGNGVAVAVAVGGSGDVVIVSPGYRGRTPMGCAALLTPSVGRSDGRSTMRQGVTYGMSPAAALTLSSIGDCTAMLAVQRELTTPLGAVVEEQELRIPLAEVGAEADAAYATLAAAGASIMLGLFPSGGT